MPRALWVLCVLCMSTGQAQSVFGGETAPAPADARLQVIGEVPDPLTLSAAEVAKLPRQTVRAKDHAGQEAEFTGVAVVDVLKRAGVKFGADLKGAALTQYLVVEASDGYRAVFSLAELDPACTDRVVLLTDRRDGKPLSSSEGPFQIVVPGEKRHARWVRQVKALKVGRAP